MHPTQSLLKCPIAAGDYRVINWWHALLRIGLGAGRNSNNILQQRETWGIIRSCLLNVTPRPNGLLVSDVFLFFPFVLLPLPRSVPPRFSCLFRSLAPCSCCWCCWCCCCGLIFLGKAFLSVVREAVAELGLEAANLAVEEETARMEGMHKR